MKTNKPIDVTTKPTTAPIVVQRERDITLGGGSTSLPSVEQQSVVLPEFDKRRRNFFAWLREHFVEGTHFGVPPGCEPKSADSKQWRSKPSLYDSGARLFLDLFGLRPTYDADLDTWKMLGSKPGTICKRCRLMNKAGEVVGEGTGVFCVGEKKMAAGSADKMAEKRARVSAVLDGIPYARELFSQDLEDLGSPLDKLKAWLSDSRAEFEDELSTDDFLAKVAEALLYGKRLITTQKEATIIQDALARGDFDLRTGERVKTPKPAQRPQDAPGSTNVAAPDIKAVWKLWMHWARARRDNGDAGFAELDRKKRSWFKGFAASVLGHHIEDPKSLAPDEVKRLLADLEKHGDPRPLDERTG